jgi:PAS domain S-box-containing protein
MLKAGAHDYIKKDNLRRLVPAARRELHAAQERLIRRQTEKTTTFLASLVQSCDDAIIGVTLDSTVVSWNLAAEKLFGFSAVEMIGRPVSVLWPENRPPEVPEAVERIKAGERVPRFETVRVRKDGQPVEVSLTLSPVKDHEGRVVGASIVARDITQRKQEENERLALIQELTAALSHAH